MKWRQNMLVVVLSLAGFVTSFGAYVVAANLPSYSKETGAGFVLALNAAVYLAVQPFAGRLSDSLGRKKVITLGLALCTVCISFIPFLPNPFYIGAACLMAVGMGCVAPLGEAFVGDVSEEDSLALNLGIAGSYKELGEMTGPLTMGFVGQALGLQWAFLMVGMAGIGSLICLGFLKETRASPEIETV